MRAVLATSDIRSKKMRNRGLSHVHFGSSNASSRLRFCCSLCFLLLCFGTDIRSSQYNAIASSSVPLLIPVLATSDIQREKCKVPSSMTWSCDP